MGPLLLEHCFTLFITQFCLKLDVPLQEILHADTEHLPGIINNTTGCW
jgi:hypothetical protein